MIRSCTPVCECVVKLCRLSLSDVCVYIRYATMDGTHQPRAARAASVPCCDDDCLTRCMCYSRFCGSLWGPPCGQPVFDVCMSPVDLRLRQLEAQEKQFGSGDGNALAVAASRIGETPTMSSASSASGMNGDEDGRSDTRATLGMRNEMFVVYMPSNGTNAGRAARTYSGAASDGGHDDDGNNNYEGDDDDDRSSSGSVTSDGHVVGAGLHEDHVRTPTSFADVMDAIRNGMAIPQSMSRGGGNHHRRGSDVILSRYVDLDEYGDDDDDNDDDDNDNDDSSSISSTGASTAAPTPSSSTLSSDDEGNDADSDCESENAPPSQYAVRM